MKPLNHPIKPNIPTWIVRRRLPGDAITYDHGIIEGNEELEDFVSQKELKGFKPAYKGEANKPYSNILYIDELEYFVVEPIIKIDQSVFKNVV